MYVHSLKAALRLEQSEDCVVDTTSWADHVCGGSPAAAAAAALLAVWLGPVSLYDWPEKGSQLFI